MTSHPTTGATGFPSKRNSERLMRLRVRPFLRLSLIFVAACGAVTAHAQADNSNSKVEPAPSFSVWMMDHPHARQDRVAQDSAVWAGSDRRLVPERRRVGSIDDVPRYHLYPVDATPVPAEVTPGSIEIQHGID